MKTKARENLVQENMRAVPTLALGGDIVSLNKILGWLSLLATLLVVGLVAGIVATHSATAEETSDTGAQ